MSMNSKNLSVLAYANGFTLWHYKTEDVKTTVSADGYFNDVQNIFNVGDAIIASVNIEGEPVTTIFVVKSITNGVVKVSALG